MALPFNISELRQRIGGVAKPFLFNVRFGSDANILTSIFGGAGRENTSFASLTVRAASIPARTIGTIPVPFFGLDLKLAGNPVFDDWTATFLVDDAYKIRNSMERWSNEVFSVSNLGDQLYKAPSNYLSSVFVEQLNENGDVLAEYTLNLAWPSVVGPVELSHESKDTLETFDVTFTYSFWTRPEAQLKI